MKWEEFWPELRRQDWCYRLDGSHSGQENMETDMRLLQEAESPTLRLYTWDRPTLSLGHNQRDNWLDRDMCQRLGVDIVRRPTGGRALLHMDDEITYAVILPQIGDISVREAFAGLAAQLTRTLQHLGVAVDAAQTNSTPAAANNPHCGEVVTAGEVCWQGHKLVGSAQMRSSGRLLQHGSLLRRGDRGLLAQIMPEAQARLTLEDIGWAQLAPEDIIVAWQETLANS